jgi:hypothetical protein
MSFASRIARTEAPKAAWRDDRGGIARPCRLADYESTGYKSHKRWRQPAVIGIVPLGGPIGVTAMIAPGERVCPRCGNPAGNTDFCTSCGVNLAALPEIPTRAEWEAATAPPRVPSSTSPALATDERLRLSRLALMLLCLVAGVGPVLPWYGGFVNGDHSLWVGRQGAAVVITLVALVGIRTAFISFHRAPTGAPNVSPELAASTVVAMVVGAIIALTSASPPAPDPSCLAIQSQGFGGSCTPSDQWGLYLTLAALVTATVIAVVLWRSAKAAAVSPSIGHASPTE